ncbi:Uncharacterized protein dnm_004320 [Desulfonema magnum]|uniref:Uncharacterized protein n=1 Tax=Desulfonema magnum TaxID=45655 RepID=A0A975BFE7_9BACT|nr:Uncharacterized protein dnm_004320 [Desulfonema magnum]
MIHSSIRYHILSFFFKVLKKFKFTKKDYLCQTDLLTDMLHYMK